MPAGTIASPTLEPARTSTQRWTMPSPPQAKTSSAPSSSARSTCAGAFLLFGTSTQNGSFDPLGLEHATKLGQAAAERLAGMGDDRNLHASPPLPPTAPATAARDAQRSDADDDAAADVERVMHAAVHARGRDERDHPDR